MNKSEWNWVRLIGIAIIALIACGYVVAHGQDAEQPVAPPAQEQAQQEVPAAEQPSKEAEAQNVESPSTRPLTDLEIETLRKFMRIMALGAKEQQSSPAISAAESLPASVQKSAGVELSSAQSALVREVPYDHFAAKLNAALVEERHCRHVFYRDRIRSSDKTIDCALHDFDEMIIGIQGVEESALAVLRFYEKEQHPGNPDAFDSLQNWAEKSLIAARLFREGLEVERSAILGIREYPERRYVLYPPHFERPDDPNRQLRNSLEEMLKERIWNLNYDLSRWSQQVERLNYGLFMTLIGDRARAQAAEQQEKKVQESPK